MFTFSLINYELFMIFLEKMKELSKHAKWFHHGTVCKNKTLHKELCRALDCNVTLLSKILFYLFKIQARYVRLLLLFDQNFDTEFE